MYLFFDQDNISVWSSSMFWEEKGLVCVKYEAVFCVCVCKHVCGMSLSGSCKLCVFMYIYRSLIKMFV